MPIDGIPKQSHYMYMIKIIPNSYALASGKWAPRAIVRSDDGDKIREHTRTWQKEYDRFDTEEQANKFVVEFFNRAENE